MLKQKHITVNSGSPPRLFIPYSQLHSVSGMEPIAPMSEIEKHFSSVLGDRVQRELEIQAWQMG